MAIFDQALMDVAGWLPAPWPYLAYGALVALFAGAVRGFAGFGLSAFIVAGMSLWISPQRIVPSAMVLEVVASISLLRSVWPHISWRWIGPLLAGYAVSVPAGVWCLAVLPEVPLRVAVSAVILCAALVLLSGFHPRWHDTIALRLGTGLASGFLSGLSAIGGMIAATMLFTTSLPAARLRATLIALFFMSASYALLWARYQGLANAATVAWAVWLVVPMLIGIAIGRHGFARVGEIEFRRTVLIVLAIVAALGLARALWALVSS